MYFGNFCNRVSAVVGNAGFAASAFFGGYNNYAIRTARAVNGCRRCVFQYFDGLYIVRVNVVQVSTVRNSINNDQRFVVGFNRVSASYHYGLVSACTCGGVLDHYARYSALNGLCDIQVRNIFQPVF